eukprot:gene8090-1333_t
MDDVRNYFSKFGQVDDVFLATDYRNVGKTRGWGFVTMGIRADAVTAVDQTHNKEYMGRSLRVNISVPKETTLLNYTASAIIKFGENPVAQAEEEEGMEEPVDLMSPRT